MIQIKLVLIAMMMLFLDFWIIDNVNVIAFCVTEFYYICVKGYYILRYYYIACELLHFVA